MELTDKEKALVTDATTIDHASLLGIPKDYHSNDGRYRVETHCWQFLGGGIGLESVSIYEHGKLIVNKFDTQGYYSAGADTLVVYAQLILDY